MMSGRSLSGPLGSQMVICSENREQVKRQVEVCTVDKRDESRQSMSVNEEQDLKEVCQRDSSG